MNIVLVITWVGLRFSSSAQINMMVCGVTVFMCLQDMIFFSAIIINHIKTLFQKKKHKKYCTNICNCLPLFFDSLTTIKKKKLKVNKKHAKTIDIFSYKFYRNILFLVHFLNNKSIFCTAALMKASYEIWNLYNNYISFQTIKLKLICGNLYST